MGRNTYANIVLTLALVAIVFFGWQVLALLDAQRFELERLSARVGNLESRPQGIVTPLAHGAVGASGDFAWRGLFDPAAEEGDRYVTSLGTEPANFNSLLTNDSALSAITNYCHSGLMGRDPITLENAPELAESYEISADKLAYRFKLRRGALWHDFTDPDSGKEFRDVEVTAHDFKFFIDVIKNPGTNCAVYRGLFEYLDSIEVVNDYEFVVHWSSPVYSAQMLSFGLAPLPRHLYWSYEGDFDAEKFNGDHKRNMMIVGCGPYKLVSHKKNQRVVLERFDKYIGARYGATPSLKYIVFDIVSHPQTRFQMLLGGDLDVIGIDSSGLSAEQWLANKDKAEFSEQGRLKMFRGSEAAYSYIGWNNARAPFNDPRVRQAMTLLIDRPRILSDIYFGFGTIPAGPILPGAKYWNESVEALPFDVARAKELLAEAGWRDSDNDGILDKDGAKFDFALLYPADSPTYERILTIAKEGMAQAGVNMRMQSFEWSVFLDKVDKRDFDAYTMGWASSIESDQYQIWHSASDVPGGSNYIHYSNAEVDEIIMALRREFDDAERERLYRRFQEIIAAEQPYTFMIVRERLGAISRRYRNFAIHPSFQYMPTATSLPLWTPRAEQLMLNNL